MGLIIQIGIPQKWMFFINSKNTTFYILLPEIVFQIRIKFVKLLI